MISKRQSRLSCKHEVTDQSNPTSPPVGFVGWRKESVNIKSDEYLKRKVWQIMQLHVGIDNRINRKSLVEQACGMWTSANDRKVRDALSELPVISTSTGGGGYWLPASESEINAWESEMLSRTQEIFKRISLARKWLRMNRQPAKAQQPMLLDV